MNTRRDFFKQLAGIGLFSILPGAGRIWVAEKKLPDFTSPWIDFLPAWTEYLQQWKLEQRALWPLLVASKVPWYPKDPAYYELFSTTPPINGATA